MRPIWHIISSLVLSVVILFFTRSITAGLVALLAGVFIDIDHLVDFWISKPKNPFSVKAFIDSDSYVKINKRIFVPLHAWEWVFLLFVVSYQLNWLLLFIFALSLGLHLILDTLYHIWQEKGSPLVYFITFRLIKKFRVFSS